MENQQLKTLALHKVWKQPAWLCPKLKNMSVNTFLNLVINVFRLWLLHILHKQDINVCMLIANKSNVFTQSSHSASLVFDTQYVIVFLC